MSVGRVAILFPAQHLLDGGGAVDVLRLEIEAVRAANLEPWLVVTAPTINPWRGLTPVRERAFGQAAAALNIQVAAVAITRLRVRAVVSWVRLVWRIMARRRFDIDADLDLNDVTGRRLASTEMPAQFDAALCNYPSGLETALALVPPSRQLVILHDLPPTRPSRRYVRMLRRMPRFMCINPDEADRCAGLAPDKEVHCGVPFRAWRTPDLDIAPPNQPAGEAFDAARPANAPPGGWNAGPWSHKPVDLLFVGGAHPPNVAGLRDFIITCFAPHLAPAGLTMTVAGTVCDGLRDLAEEPNFALLGRTDDLTPLYRAAKLVVVPLLSGTGISMKTLDALSRGKAVLSTPVGLRGTGIDGSLALGPPFDGRWVRAVRDLVSTESARALLTRRLLADLDGMTLTESLAHILPALVTGTSVRPFGRETVSLPLVDPVSGPSR